MELYCTRSLVTFIGDRLKANESGEVYTRRLVLNIRKLYLYNGILTPIGQMLEGGVTETPFKVFRIKYTFGRFDLESNKFYPAIRGKHLYISINITDVYKYIVDINTFINNIGLNTSDVKHANISDIGNKITLHLILTKARKHECK